MRCHKSTATRLWCSSVARANRSTGNAKDFHKLAKEEKPVLTKRVDPVYPEEALKQKLNGKVFVRFRIGTDGKVDSVQILKGASIFQDAAIDAPHDSHPDLP